MDKAAFAVLQAELEERCRDLRHIYERLEQRTTQCKKTAEGLDSMAYQLHNLYSAFEQLFELVAHTFENHIEGGRYHTDLLRRMKLEIEGIRPALICAATFALLDELRRFRHFFRHAYTAELDREKVEDLVATAQRLKQMFQKDREVFLARLVP